MISIYCSSIFNLGENLPLVFLRGQNDIRGKMERKRGRRMNKKNKVSTWVLIFLIGWLSMFAVSTSDAQVSQSSWKITTIDSEGKLGYTTSIATDPQDKVHITYWDMTNLPSSTALKYATNASGSWVISTVDSEGVVGEDSSVAIDMNDKVHITYWDGSKSRTKYATNALGQWVTSTIDDGITAFASIALDSNNNIHISYISCDYNCLKYTTNVSGTWTASTIDSLGPLGGFTSLALDSNDRIHICYLRAHQSTFDLMYATNASGSWAISTLDSYGEGGFKSDHSIAIDLNNRAHIVYSDEITSNLKYATNASGSWTTSMIDSDGWTWGGNPSIAIDSANKVHICYFTRATSELKYATNASGSWVISTIDRGMFASIAIDYNDKVHICYGGIYDLKYVTNSGSINPTLTVLKSGAGNGTVTSSPAGINCGNNCTEDVSVGTKITLGAKPDSNSIFIGWSGSGCSGTGKCVVMMNTDTSVSASFSAKTPHILVALTSLDFGTIKVGKKATKTLKITNSGSGNLVVTISGIEGTDFSVIGSSNVIIKPKKTCNLKVAFNPSSTGPKTATLKIISNDPDTPTMEIPFSGTGL